MAVRWQTKAGEAVKTEVQNKSGFISAQKMCMCCQRLEQGSLAGGISFFYQSWAEYILRTGQTEGTSIRGHTKRINRDGVARKDGL